MCTHIAHTVAQRPSQVTRTPVYRKSKLKLILKNHKLSDIAHEENIYFVLLVYYFLPTCLLTFQLVMLVGLFFSLS